MTPSWSSLDWRLLGLAVVVASLASAPALAETPAGPEAEATQAPAPEPVASPTPDPVTASLTATLEQSLVSFNKADFGGYLHDFAPKITYNELLVDRTRLVEINKELHDSFPNLRMRYKRMRINPIAGDEASATTISEYSGTTNNYDGSGLPARYREEGQVTALYQTSGGPWLTHQLEVAWNDSYIDIGQEFGSMGFTTLPVLVGAAQPYRLRFYTGDDEREGMGVAYAYAVVPLKAVIEKEGAEQVFQALKFSQVPRRGVDKEFHAPAAPGTYAHILVANKFWRAGKNESIAGQKIYTRLVRVE